MHKIYCSAKNKQPEAGVGDTTCLYCIAAQFKFTQQLVFREVGKP